MIEEAKIELQKIEHNNRTFKSDFAREMAIFEDIAIHINTKEYKSKEKKYWNLVMDLYKEKYNKL
jgi:hypothetical protein